LFLYNITKLELHSFCIITCSAAKGAKELAKELFSYARAGVASVRSGRDWFDRDLCAYCRTQLTEFGSYHIPSNNLAKDGEFGEAMCLACGSRTARIDHNRAPKMPDGYEMPFYFPLDVTPGAACFFRVAICSHCGWWYVIENADECNDGFANVYAGILHCFDLSSASIPLEVLEAELPKKVTRIDGIHPKRMEDLISRMLAGVLDCEVHQLGYTRDGGIDLVLLNSDNPIAVQVKRRQDHRKTEGVRGIREFLGAALLQDFSHLIYVTNAERYSKEAKNAAKLAMHKGLVQKFDLISLDKLKSIFQHNKPHDVWREAIRAVMRKEYVMPSIPDPYNVIAEQSASLDDNSATLHFRQ
jgi:hypothetical protein